MLPRCCGVFLLLLMHLMVVLPLDGVWVPKQLIPYTRPIVPKEDAKLIHRMQCSPETRTGLAWRWHRYTGGSNSAMVSNFTRRNDSNGSSLVLHFRARCNQLHAHYLE